MTEQVVLSGMSDIEHLRSMKNVLINLQGNWLQEGNRFVVSGDQKEDFNKRMMLLESEIEGLMKRRVNASTADSTGRVLDYDILMNEKENQLVELEKKINNLEDKLRRSTKRNEDLENEIVRLTQVIKATSNTNLSKIDIDRLCITHVDYESLNEKYSNLRGQLLSFGSLYKTQMDKLKTQGVRMENESTLDALLRGENMRAETANGVVSLIEIKEKVIEVPTQDSRTKHLIHLLATQMKKNFDKYPKLRDECDVRLVEFFQQELIDVMEID